MSGVPLFELDGVSLGFDGAVILGDIDLAIADTGITVVVGPSGSGKSMLLRLLNRLEVPTAGEVRFRGEPVDRLDPRELRRRVGMVFQRPAPFPGTVRDNLLVADPGADERRLTAALADARLDAAYLDRDADELSGGEAQRMCLARTLVTRPEALLMDEPTSALDPDARRGLERTARRLATAGRPLVWVTHDLEQCERLADEVVVLIGGHLAGDEERARFLADEDVHDGGADDVRTEGGAGEQRDNSAGDARGTADRDRVQPAVGDFPRRAGGRGGGPVARGAAGPTIGPSAPGAGGPTASGPSIGPESGSGGLTVSDAAGPSIGPRSGSAGPSSGPTTDRTGDDADG